MNFAGKRVLIMGLGIQGGGVGVARFFAEKGAKVTVTDLKTKEELAPSIKSLSDLPLASLTGLPITFILGKHREVDFKNTDLVIRNPDVDKNSPYLEIAREHGAIVEMDESLFLRLWQKKENIIGVTGTRGKTTTTHLIGIILKQAGLPTLLGGNLRGIATLSLLDKATPETKIVLELSSWQLQGLDWNKLSPHVAVITNIYPDHLNRYKNMEEYVADKKIIFRYQKEKDLLVLNAKDKISKNFVRQAKSRIIWFCKSNVPELIMASFKLRGSHNLENLAAAYAVAKILKINDKIVKEAVGSFAGVPFRLEEIRTLDGVTYVNDTTSTTPTAAIAALKAYQKKPIILIAGGASKNLDLSDFGREIDKRVKALALLEGLATSELEKAIKNKKLIMPRFDNFRKVILAAKNKAAPGDIVLLSPGCASFGMFKNEFDRGEQFNEIIFSIASKSKTS